MDERREKILHRVEENLTKDERKFTIVAAAVNDGITQGIQAFVPKKFRSIRDNAQEQA